MRKAAPSGVRREKPSSFCAAARGVSGPAKLAKVQFAAATKRQLVGGGSSFLIDSLHCDLRQLFIRRLLLVERLLKQFGDFIVAKLLCEGPSAAVARHLVVLDALASRDNRGVANIVFHV